MICPNCERMRKALSPLEDREFTEKYLANQPTGWLADCVAAGFPRITLPVLWERTFPGTTPNPLDLTKLGRTLDALGWRRTKYNGLLQFYINI